MLNLIHGVNTLFNIYEFVIVAWCILSWIPSAPGGILDDVKVVVNRLVEPYIGIFRRFIPSFGGIDFSPVIAILALSIIQNLVLRLLLGAF